MKLEDINFESIRAYLKNRREHLAKIKEMSKVENLNYEEIILELKVVFVINNVYYYKAESLRNSLKRRSVSDNDIDEVAQILEDIGYNIAHE